MVRKKVVRKKTETPKKIAVEEAIEEVEETADTIAIAVEETEEVEVEENTTAVEEVEETETTEEVEELEETADTTAIGELEKRIEEVEEKNKELEEKIEALENRTLYDMVVPKKIREMKEITEWQLKKAKEELAQEPEDVMAQEEVKVFESVLKLNNDAIAICTKRFGIGE